MKNAVRRIARNLLSILLTLLYLVGIAWASGAIYYDAPLSREGDRLLLTIGYALVVLLMLVALGSPRLRFLWWMLSMGIVVIPWSLKNPGFQPDWKPGGSRLPSAVVEGSSVTFQNLRHFQYDEAQQTTERWESRTVDLSKLEALDFVHHELGDSQLAHPLLSFDFGDDGHIAFSVEIRYRNGQDFSPVQGLYKQYDLIYLVGDERDFLQERALVRDEPVRLYRLTYPLERVLEIFHETSGAMNSLRENPRFYNTLTTNCTTSYLRQSPARKRPRFDYRIILNGMMESLLYEREVIATEGLSLSELKTRASINEAAREARKDPEFSTRIREGRPGF